MADSPTSPSVSNSMRSPTFAALRQSGFRRYYIGQGISLAGSWLQAAAVRWLVFERTNSEYMLGVVEVASLLPGIFVGLYAGALADRVRPLRMILLMECCQMALAFLLTALVGFNVFHIWQMAMVLALARICVTFELPSRQVLFFELVGPETLSNAIALNSGLFNATRVLGPALAGVCLSLFGATGCFALNAVSFMAAIAAVLSIRLKPRAQPHHHESFGLGVILGGLRFLREDRKLLAQFLLVTFFGVVAMGYEAMIPAYAARVVHTGVRGYSVLLACGGVGATAGALVVASLGGLRKKKSTPHADRHDHFRRRTRRRCAHSRLAARARGARDRPWLRRLRCLLIAGFGNRPLLFLVDDPHSDGRARPSPRPDDGYLDDRLFGLRPIGRTLDRTGSRGLGRRGRHGVLGRGLRRHCGYRPGIKDA